MTLFFCKLFGWFCATATPIDQGGPVAWPNKAWESYLYEKLVNMPYAKDEKQLCPRGLSQKNWLNLFTAMAKHESNFRPALTFKEDFKNSRGEWVISTGLFQLSYESARGYGFTGITTEQLKDPYKNIDVAVKIMRTLVGRHGVVSGKSGTKWLGGAAYWSVFRSGKAQATLKTLCE